MFFKLIKSNYRIKKEECSLFLSSLNLSIFKNVISNFLSLSLYLMKFTYKNVCKFNIYRERNIDINSDVNKEIDRYIDRQKDRQTDIQTDRQTDRQNKQKCAMCTFFNAQNHLKFNNDLAFSVIINKEDI